MAKLRTVAARKAPEGCAGAGRTRAGTGSGAQGRARALGARQGRSRIRLRAASSVRRRCGGRGEEGAGRVRAFRPALDESPARALPKDANGATGTAKLGAVAARKAPEGCQALRMRRPIRGAGGFERADPPHTPERSRALRRRPVCEIAKSTDTRAARAPGGPGGHATIGDTLRPARGPSRRLPHVQAQPGNPRHRDRRPHRRPPSSSSPKAGFVILAIHDLRAEARADRAAAQADRAARAGPRAIGSGPRGRPRATGSGPRTAPAWKRRPGRSARPARRGRGRPGSARPAHRHRRGGAHRPPVTTPAASMRADPPHTPERSRALRRPPVCEIAASTDTAGLPGAHRGRGEPDDAPAFTPHTPERSRAIHPRPL